MMTATIIVIAVLLIIAGLTFYALHKGYGVKTGLKTLGLSLSFEAQKPVKGEVKTDCQA